MAPCNESDLPNDTISFLPLAEETTSAKRQRSTISTGIITSTPLPTLPIDVIVEILCMLPMKFLRQLRCICKSWNALISDPTFRAKYLRLSVTHYLIRLSFRSNLTMFLSELSDLSTFSYKKSKLTYPYRLKNKYGTPLCIRSCDGFLCFVTKISYVILWNPSLRAFKILPPLKNSREREYISSSYNFGYDRLIDDYKIVAIFFFKDKVEVNIYTMGRVSWRRIQEFPRCSFIRGPGVFLDGTVNWLTFYDSSSTSCAIVSLDLEKESYQKLSQPDLEKNKNWTLGELNDCLCIFASSDTFFDVWIMKEYGNKESWTKLYHIPYIPSMSDQDLFMTLYISKDDQILMDFYYDLEKFKLKLVVYDCKKNTFKILKSSKINNLDGP